MCGLYIYLCVSLSMRLTPFSGVAHLGLACHQYLLLPIYLPPSPPRICLVVYMPSPSGRWTPADPGMVTVACIAEHKSWHVVVSRILWHVNIHFSICYYGRLAANVHEYYLLSEQHALEGVMRYTPLSLHDANSILPHCANPLGELIFLWAVTWVFWRDFSEQLSFVCQ